MRKTLLAVALLLAASPAFSQYCSNCILNSAAPQNAQFNVTSGTVRGILTVGTLNIADMTMSGTLTAAQLVGGGSGITALNASALASGTVPQARIAGPYAGITGVGTLAAGIWQASTIAPGFGGTGADLSIAGTAGGLPYFVGGGVEGVLPSPGGVRVLLTAGSGAAPVWVSSPPLTGQNFSAIPLTALDAGHLPHNIQVDTNSIANVNGAGVLGNIPNGAAFLTIPLPIGNLAGGTLPTSNAASSVTASGVGPGYYGGPTTLAQFQVRWDGRIYDAQQFPLIVYSTMIQPGTFPAGVLIPAAQVSAGILANNVIASSVGANGVYPGVYGGPTSTPQITITADGRITSATSFNIPGVSTATAFKNVDNAWSHAQTSMAGSSWTIRDNELVTGTLTAGFFVGDGSGITNITAASVAAYNVTAGALNPSVKITTANVGPGFNGSNQLVQLNALSQFPALDAHLLTALTAANISAGNLGPFVVASSVAANGVTPGICGDATHICAPTFTADGRAVSYSSPTISGGISGGVVNYMPVWSGASTLGNSHIWDQNSPVVLTSMTVLGSLGVNGDAYVTGPLTASTFTATGIDANGFSAVFPGTVTAPCIALQGGTLCGPSGGGGSPSGPAGGVLAGSYPAPRLGPQVVLSTHIANGSVGDGQTNLSTGAIASGKFGDTRVAITTGAISGPFTVGVTSSCSPGFYFDAQVTVAGQVRGGSCVSASGAGVSQIVAGTNITISPPGGTGVVTINATGGGAETSYFGPPKVFGSSVTIYGNVSSTGTFTSSRTINTGDHYEIAGSTVLSTGEDPVNIFLGVDAGASTFAPPAYDTFLGAGAGQANVSGVANTYAGYHAGHAATSGSNSAFGYAAGDANTGNNLTAVGYEAGTSNAGNFDTLIGYFAGSSNNGANNVFLGKQTGQNSVGADNIALGRVAAQNNVGASNIMMGAAAGQGNTGSRSMFFGTQAGSGNTTDDILIIDNATGTNPLMTGNLAAGKLGINTPGLPTAYLDVNGDINAASTMTANHLLISGAPGGFYSLADFKTAGGNAIVAVRSLAAPGTVQVAMTVELIGTGTKFLSTFSPGDKVLVQGETQRTVQRVVSDTDLFVAVTSFTQTASGLSYSNNSQAAVVAFSSETIFSGLGGSIVFSPKKQQFEIDLQSVEGVNPRISMRADPNNGSSTMLLTADGKQSTDASILISTTIVTIDIPVNISSTPADGYSLRVSSGIDAGSGCINIQGGQICSLLQFVPAGKTIAYGPSTLPTGTTGYFAIWTGTGTLGNAMMKQSGAFPGVEVTTHTKVDGNAEFGGLIETSGTSPTTSVCGTGPSNVGDNNNGRITTGTLATSCTITFDNTHPWTNTPICRIASAISTALQSITAASATAVTFAAAGGVTYDYDCHGYK